MGARRKALGVEEEHLWGEEEEHPWGEEGLRGQRRLSGVRKTWGKKRRVPEVRKAPPGFRPRSV